MNVVERAVILATGGVLPLTALASLGAACVPPPGPRRPSDPPAPRSSLPDPESTRLEDVDRQHILAVLETTNWVVGGPRGAAARLGMKRPTLIYRMKKLGIERGSRGT